MDNYSGSRGAHGKSACGWWFPAREFGPCFQGRGTYVVSLGTQQKSEGDELWCANFGAVVDDFGTLRIVKQAWEAA